MSSEGTTPDPDAAEEESGGSTGSSQGGSGVSTNPNESAGEHESMAVADSDSQEDPGETMGGGQMGG
jgi:hypothetical protein